MNKKDDFYEYVKNLDLTLPDMKTVRGKARITKIGEDGLAYEVIEEIELPYFEDSTEDSNKNNQGR